MGASGSKFKAEREAIQNVVQEIYSKPNMQNACESFIPILESQLRKHLRIELIDVRDAIIMVPQGDSVDVKGKHRKKQEICEQISKHYNRVLDLVQMICNVYNIEGGVMKSIAELCLSNIYLQSRSLIIQRCLNHRQVGNSDPSFVDISTLAGLSVFLDSLTTKGDTGVLDSGKQDFLNSLRNLLSNHDRPFCSNLYEIQNCKTKTVQDSTETPATTFMRLHKRNPNLSDGFCYNTEREDIVVRSDSPKWNEARRLYRKLHDDYAKGLQNIRELLQEILTNKGTLRSKTISITDKELSKLEHRAKEHIMNFYFTSLQNYYTLLDLAIAQSENPRAINDHMN
jgi:hypothetical protein